MAQFSVCFVGVLFFLPHLCGISFARCRSSDLPFVCWILFFLVSSTPYNPRSRCSSLLKLAAEQESFCFAFFLSVFVPEGGGGCGGPVSSLVVSTLFLSPQCLDL